jgi:outer membrane protein TolC
VLEHGRASRVAAQAGDNPALVLQHTNVFDGPQDRETVVGLQLPVVVSGRRGLLREAATARFRQARFQSSDVLLRAALDVRELHARAVIAESRRRILGRQQAALEALATVVAALAKSGETATYDATRQRLEADTHRRQLVAAAAEASSLRAELEAWTNRRFALGEVEISDRARGSAEVAPAADRHPRLRALDAAARADGLEERAARRRAVPDPQVFAGYRRLQTEEAVAHGVALGLTLPLTVFDTGAGQSARAHADLLTTRAALAVERRRLTARAQAVRASLVALQAELDRAPQPLTAEHMRKGAAQLYAAGEMPMSALLDAYQAAENAELSRLALLEQFAVARIELMDVLGTQFDSELDRACSGHLP